MLRKRKGVRHLLGREMPFTEWAYCSRLFFDSRLEDRWKGPTGCLFCGNNFSIYFRTTESIPRLVI